MEKEERRANESWKRGLSRKKERRGREKSTTAGEEKRRDELDGGAEEEEAKKGGKTNSKGKVRLYLLHCWKSNHSR